MSLVHAVVMKTVLIIHEEDSIHERPPLNARVGLGRVPHIKLKAAGFQADYPSTCLFTYSPYIILVI